MFPLYLPFAEMSDFSRPSSCPDGPVSDSSCSQLAAEKELRVLSAENLAYKALMHQQSESADRAISVLRPRVVFKERECAELAEALEALEAKCAEFLEALCEMEDEFAAKNAECAAELGVEVEVEVEVESQETHWRFYFECLLLLLAVACMFAPTRPSHVRGRVSGVLLLSPRGPGVCTDLAVLPPLRYPVCPVAPQCPMRWMPRVVGVSRLGLAAMRQPQRVRTALDAMPLVLEKRVEEVIPEAVLPEAVLPEAAQPEERGSSTVLVPALRLGVTALGLYAWHLHMLTYAAGALVLRIRTIPGYHR